MLIVSRTRVSSLPGGLGKPLIPVVPLKRLIPFGTGEPSGRG